MEPEEIKVYRNELAELSDNPSVDIVRKYVEKYINDTGACVNYLKQDAGDIDTNKEALITSLKCFLNGRIGDLQVYYSPLLTSKGSSIITDKSGEKYVLTKLLRTNYTKDPPKTSNVPSNNSGLSGISGLKSKGLGWKLPPLTRSNRKNKSRKNKSRKNKKNSRK